MLDTGSHVIFSSVEIKIVMRLRVVARNDNVFFVDIRQQRHVATKNILACGRAWKPAPTPQSLLIIQPKENIMKKLLTIIFTAITLISIGGIGVWACNWVRPRTNNVFIPSNDGTRVFSHTARDYGNFVSSGVYTNSSPHELVYSIDLPESIRLSGLLFSDDMDYIIVFTSPSSPHLNCFLHFEVFFRGDLIFYRDRQDIFANYNAKYTGSQCVCGPSFLHDISSADFSSSTNTLTITTTERRTFVFDITTGEIISQSRAVRIVPIIVLVAAVVVTAVCIFLLIKNRKNPIENEVPHEQTTT